MVLVSYRVSRSMISNACAVVRLLLFLLALVRGLCTGYRNFVMVFLAAIFVRGWYKASRMLLALQRYSHGYYLSSNQTLRVLHPSSS